MIPRFRIWYENRWLKSPVIHSDGTVWMDSRDDNPDIRDKVIVEPSTGLTDKNGKEIFEGDIVKTKSNSDNYLDGKVCTIAFRNGRFELPEIDINGEDLWVFTDKEYNRNHHSVEVIGNIHENPELLDA